MPATASWPSTTAAPPVVAALAPIMAVVLIAFLVIGLALPVLPLHVHDDLVPHDGDFSAHSARCLVRQKSASRLWKLRNVFQRTVLGLGRVVVGLVAGSQFAALSAR